MVFSDVISQLLNSVGSHTYIRVKMNDLEINVFTSSVTLSRKLDVFMHICTEKSKRFHGNVNFIVCLTFLLILLKHACRRHRGSKQNSEKLDETLLQITQNSTTMYHTDLRLGDVLYTMVFYNISCSWPFSLHRVAFILV